MADINIKSIRYPATVDEKMDKLALKLGRTKLCLFTQIVEYFYKSKKDPSDFNDEVLKREIANGIARIISFIRKQESDFLLPIFTDTGLSTKIQKQHTLYIKEIVGHLIKEEEQIAKLLNRMTILDQAIAKTQTHQEEKAGLKTKFEKILEYYIHHRETLGWPISAAKKEELQNHVRQSIKNL